MKELDYIVIIKEYQKTFDKVKKSLKKFSDLLDVLDKKQNEISENLQALFDEYGAKAFHKKDYVVNLAINEFITDMLRATLDEGETLEDYLKDDNDK